MEEFKAGDRVHVEYDGTVVKTASGGDRLGVEDASGMRHYYYRDTDTIKITRGDPASWPPQPGDIWAAELAGCSVHEFFIRSKHGGGIIITPDDGGGSWTLESLTRYNPVLVRRRDQ